jgi:predicted HAD superfamily Cof-like phosphohydrolase
VLNDNKRMQKHFGMDREPLTLEQLKFRVQSLLNEEMGEALEALDDKNAEELVDAHIDLMVIALGNLYLMGVDINKAWKEVYRANMSKVRGVKPGREESGGFDLMKPEGWVPPNHSDNHGVLDELFK